MARPLRIEFPGGLYHVTARGDRREDIFVDDHDRNAWLAVFSEVCRRFNWRCHAYCMMDNHYHILVETVDGNLSAGMRQLNGVYTQRSNRRHHRSGHVFQGRFKSIVVERDSYLLELARYVVLNPVRAGMVGDVADWRWSSYGAMVGEVQAPDWLYCDWLLSQFGQQRKRCRRKYQEFVCAGLGLASPCRAVKGQIYLGDDDFIQRIRCQIPQQGDLGEVPRGQRRPVKPLDDYTAQYPDRHEAMARAYLSGGYTLKEIGEHFEVHYSTVSRAVRGIESRK